jgi:hypothetical protein
MTWCLRTRATLFLTVSNTFVWNLLSRAEDGGRMFLRIVGLLSATIQKTTSYIYIIIKISFQIIAVSFRAWFVESVIWDARFPQAFVSSWRNHVTCCFHGVQLEKRVVTQLVKEFPTLYRHYHSHRLPHVPCSTQKYSLWPLGVNTSVPFLLQFLTLR